MNLSDLNSRAKAYKTRKRRGRGPGSGLGKTSGRGTKGARSRAGYTERPGHAGGALPFVRRFPKRGFKNPFKVQYDIVNVTDLNDIAGTAEIDLDMLIAQGIVKSRFGRLKVLGNGKLERKVIVKAARFTARAKQQIEERGGEARAI